MMGHYSPQPHLRWEKKWNQPLKKTLFSVPCLSSPEYEAGGDIHFAFKQQMNESPLLFSFQSKTRDSQPLIPPAKPSAVP